MSDKTRPGTVDGLDQEPIDGEPIEEPAEGEEPAPITEHCWVGIYGTDREGYVAIISGDAVTIRTVDRQEFTVPIELVEHRPEPGVVEAGQAAVALVQQYVDDLGSVVDLEEFGRDLAMTVLTTCRSAARSAL